MKIPILILIIFVHKINGEESCSEQALRDRFYVRRANAQENEVTNGTTVTTRCLSTGKFSWAFCQNGKWIFPDENCPMSNDVKIQPRPSRRKKRFLGGLFRFVVRIGKALVCGIFSCPGRRPRDRTPPKIRSCPPDQTVTAIPIQHHAFVDWTPPTAWDDRDGQISAHINGPYRPGGPFFEQDDRYKPTTVGYYARDSSGNMATCNFNIYVNVIRCPVRSNTIPDGYRNCHPSSDMVLGTVCWYGCYQGHTLKGAPSRIECTDTGEWSSKDEPYCEKKECFPVVPRGQLSFSCTTDFYFRSICTFKCGEGYDIPTTQPRTKVCLASGDWNGDDPDCIDVAPPTFEQCPSTLIFYPGDNKDIAYITWNRPVVVDNKDSGLEPRQIEGPLPASEQEVNTYTVKYTAEDLTGNQAKDCSFEVVVKQLRCPKLYPLPYMKLNCTGTRRGSECSFSCDDNSQLVGPRQTYCKRNGDVPYSEWIMDFHPSCEISNGCPDLVPPANGALACDVWVGGRFCHPLCSQGYSVLYNLPNILVCQDNGIWTKHDQLSDCFDITNSQRRHVTMSAEFYFSGNCSNPDTEMKIKEKFLIAIKNSDSYLVQKMCISPECNIGNVKVICSSSRKRSTENFRILTEIYFESENGTLTSKQYEAEVSTYTTFLASLESEMKSGNFSLQIDDKHAFLLEITSNDLSLECPENSVPVFKSVVACVKCPPGTFYDDFSRTCVACAKGSYQPYSARSSCFLCSDTQTTATTGAMDVTECEDACLPGTWSLNGLPPCVECDIGYYEDKFGSTSCTRCPGNRITLKESSDDISACVEYDIVFPDTPNSTYTVLQLHSVSMKIPFVISFHVKCQTYCQGTIFELYSSNGEEIELTTDSLKINLNLYDLLALPDLSHKWHHLEVHFDRNNTILFIDGLENQIFMDQLELSLSDYDVNVTLGGNGFIGSISQLNVVSKETYEINQPSYSSCNSENVPSDKTNWNDFAYSNLINAYISIPSKCDDYDDCLKRPCEKGNCTDQLGDYTCDCDIGYSGKNCEVNLDDCVAHTCQNNATCVDEVNNYSCACEYGFTGKLCEIAMVDGSWSKWDNWTECSVSCGNGTIQRRRTCSDPLPDNGGKYCEGSDTETDQCSLEPCRECSVLVEPDNSTLSCTNSSGMIVCSLKCDEGFDFDHDVKGEYRCGNETYHYWDFQTEDNPYGRLPYCTEIVESNKIHVKHSAFYDMAECDTSSIADVTNKISSRLSSAVQQLTCVRSNICNLSSNKIINCEKSRKKRSTTESNVGFSLTLTCDTSTYGTDKCFYGLEDAITELKSLENSTALEVLQNSRAYNIIHNSSTSDSSLDCPVGSVAVLAYCVPCSIGHYAKGDDCLSCPRGMYQDRTGQTFCFSCPEGMTTEGTDSISVDDCNVPTYVPEEENELPIVLGVCLTLPVITIVVFVVIAFRHNRICKTKQKEKLLKEKQHDKASKPRLNPKMLTAEKDGYFNKVFDFEDVSLSFNSMPPIGNYFPTNSAVGGSNHINGHTCSRPDDFPIEPRECWTPESSSNI